MIDQLLEAHFDAFFEETNPLKAVCWYVMEGGKRIRPAIAMEVCNTISGGVRRKIGIGSLGIEYVHSASLIIDDLPCMDNALFRRNKQCIHLKYGEAIAQLCSVVLMSMAFDAVTKELQESNLPQEEIHQASMFFLRHYAHVLGHHGAPGGQLLDLAATQEDIGTLLKGVSKEIDVEEIIAKKTGTFFEASFLTGWIFGSGSYDKIEDVKRIAHDFSMVFQIVDDIEDMEEDIRTNKKNVSQNYAIRYGREKAILDAHAYAKKCTEGMVSMGIYTPFFKDIIESLLKKIA